MKTRKIRQQQQITVKIFSVNTKQSIIIIFFLIVQLKNIFNLNEFKNFNFFSKKLKCIT